MNVKWISPLDELPKVGEVVWICMRHWKAEPIQSFEIFGAEIEEGEPEFHPPKGEEHEYNEFDPDLDSRAPVMAWNIDWTGGGSLRWPFPANEFQHRDCNFIYAWTRDIPSPPQFRTAYSP